MLKNRCGPRKVIGFVVGWNAEALDLAVQRGDFHAQQLRGASLIAASTLQRVLDQLHLVALNFFLQRELLRWTGLAGAQRVHFAQNS